MFEKIGKSNKAMGLIAVTTLVIVAIVLVYKPWKAKNEGQA